MVDIINKKLLELISKKKKISIRQLPVNCLEVDSSYQGNFKNQFHIDDLAEYFDLFKFGAILVASRKNINKYFILDGQHRVDAYIQYCNKNDIKISCIPSIYCVVIETNNVEEEADIFTAINIDRRRVSTFEGYKAGVVAGNEPYFSMDNWLNQNGFYFVRKGSQNHNQISFVKEFIDSWSVDSESAKKAIIMQRKILEPEEGLIGVLHKGFRYLYKKGCDIDQYVEKIKRAGGKEKLLWSINKCKISERVKVSSNYVAGLGITNIINLKLREKNRINLEK